MIDITKIISEYEGGYSNVPGDLGGETYAGISRKYNPDWQGWETLDLIPQAHKTTNAKFIELTSAVDNFYTDNYIKKYSLNSFS
ncbi:MAG: hypothetical protein LBD41_05040, partial [Clostridiales Family XIII bacterium]|nr:hypothetical protein [Clostridiales Family XIII bacterium]